MNARATFHGLVSKVTFFKAPPEPQLVNQPRKMTGFFAQLTEEQKKFALSYQGAENHGNPEFKTSRK